MKTLAAVELINLLETYLGENNPIGPATEKKMSVLQH